jgi:hypothetical protein
MEVSPLFFKLFEADFDVAVAKTGYVLRAGFD